MNRILKKYRQHPLGLKRYGFYSEYALPKGKFTEVHLKNLVPKDWCKTGDFKNANNHCGAVCAANILLYLEQEKDCLKMFERTYQKIGDGPIVRLSNHLKKLNPDLEVRTGIQDIEEEMKRQRPVSLLLCKAINDFHWVMVVGVRKYEDGRVYYRIVDGWNNSTHRYFDLDEGAVVISAQSYTLKGQVK